MALKRAGYKVELKLTAEAVERASLSLQCVDHIHGSDSLPLGVLGICDGIPDDVLEEHFQHSSGFFIDKSRDSLHSTSAGQTSDCWLRDTLDVITQHLPVTLGSSFPQAFTSFSSSRHDFDGCIVRTELPTYYE